MVTGPSTRTVVMLLDVSPPMAPASAKRMAQVCLASGTLIACGNGHRCAELVLRNPFALRSRGHS